MRCGCAWNASSRSRYAERTDAALYTYTGVPCARTTGSNATPSQTSACPSRKNPTIVRRSYPMIPLPVSIDVTIQRAAEGDQSAWETIVRTYWRKVFNVAYRFVGTYDEAEDLTQEIFLKVVRSLST